MKKSEERTLARVAVNGQNVGVIAIRHPVNKIGCEHINDRRGRTTVTRRTSGSIL